MDELGSALLPLRGGTEPALADGRRSGLTISRAGRVLSDVYVTGSPVAAAARLREAGMSVEATGARPLPVVEGWIPAPSLAAVAKIGATSAVLPVTAGGTDTGSVLSQGVAPHRIPQALAAFPGANGAGVDVGVISDSINRVGAGVAGSQATGDLPSNVSVLADGPPTSDDEGRAMAEIVFDEAPGIPRILFSTGSGGAVSKAASIDSLVANGADVIADDTVYLSEPMFQEGQVALAVDRAQAANVAYFASAGNRARQSYEQGFRSNGGAPALHDFDPGAGTDTLNGFNLSVQPGDFIQVVLQWDEPWGGATTDLDLRLKNTATNTTVASSTNDNIATGLPLEVATFANATASPVNVGAEVTRAAGTRAPLMKWIEFDGINGTPVPQFDTASDAINPDAASAQGSFAVAAVAAGDPGNDTPESFSSRGLPTRLFDAAGTPLAAPLTLQKPQGAAADGVSTSVPGFDPFFGTSAAAPSAAGIAALLRSANPAASVSQVYATLGDPANAIDCTLTAGAPDADCGAGFLLADSALDQTGPVIAGRTAPRRPNGRHGWFVRPVGVIFSVTERQSQLFSTSGCVRVTDRRQGKRTFTCTATSGGGTSRGRVKVKLDSRPPVKPKLKGISRGAVFDPGGLPARGTLKCRSRDRTSGLASCRIKGYSRSPGRHTLKAIATDRAGLRSISRVPYSVR